METLKRFKLPYFTVRGWLAFFIAGVIGGIIGGLIIHIDSECTENYTPDGRLRRRGWRR